MRLVSRRELAEILGVSLRTTYDLEYSGAIRRAVSEGAIVRFDPDECRRRLQIRADAGRKARKSRTLLTLAELGRGGLGNEANARS